MRKIVIVPDVHGRLFWRDILGYEYEKVVFLGDYLDPYPYEWEDLDRDTLRRNTIENFKDIVEFKKANPKKVILLLGNHDCEYAYGKSICDCRCDRDNYEEIQDIFRTNHNLFNLAHSEEIGGKRFIFSHAGILKKWLEGGYDKKILETCDIPELLNNGNNIALTLAFPDESKIGGLLGCVDGWRGGYDDYGSCVWGDIRAILQDDEELCPPGFHIVGHTQMERELIDEEHGIACLDCREAFYITEEGTIKKLKDE